MFFGFGPQISGDEAGGANAEIADDGLEVAGFGKFQGASAAFYPGDPYQRTSSYEEHQSCEYE